MEISSKFNLFQQNVGQIILYILIYVCRNIYVCVCVCVCISCDGGGSGVEVLYLGLGVLVIHVTMLS